MCASWALVMAHMHLLQRLNPQIIQRCLTQGALAHRVLGLLWELTFAPGAPAEVAQSPVLSDSLHHYAGMGSDGIDMVWDYIKRCISQVMLCCHDMPP